MVSSCVCFCAVLLDTNATLSTSRVLRSLKTVLSFACFQNFALWSELLEQKAACVLVKSIGPKTPPRLVEHCVSGAFARGTPCVTLATFTRLVQFQSVFTTNAWECLVVDEAEILFSAASKAARACRELRSAHRIALVAQPFRKKMREFWTLFSYVQDDLLGVSDFGITFAFSYPVDVFISVIGQTGLCVFQERVASLHPQLSGEREKTPNRRGNLPGHCAGHR